MENALNINLMIFWNRENNCSSPVQYPSSGDESIVMIDYYKILGVEKDATSIDVKKSYRKLAAQYHPDRVCLLPPRLMEFATEDMKRINRVKEILMDEGNRKNHDEELTRGDWGSGVKREAESKLGPQPNTPFQFGCPYCRTKVSAMQIEKTYVVTCPACRRHMTIPPSKAPGNGGGPDKLLIYTEAMKRALMDGVITSDEGCILEGLRGVLKITPSEHQKILFNLQYTH